MNFSNLITRNLESASIDNHFSFPGRWVGGVSLVLAPLLFLIGMLIRIQYHFFFPQQLEAFSSHPRLIVSAYNLFIIGNILLFPAIITITNMIGKKRSQLAIWGGMFVLLGLFARTFQAGINHLAFQLVTVQGLDNTTRAIADTYGAFNIVATLNGTIMFGWIILAFGAYLSGTLGLFRSIAMGLMAALMSGVLKGSSPYSVIAATGLCVALIPLGIKILSNGPHLKKKELFLWSGIIIVVVTSLYFLGQAG